MTVILHGVEVSPAVRASLLTVKALGLDVEMKTVSLLAGDQFKPDFLKINPFHTVPVLQDGDFNIWDSHAINCYLVDKYGKDDSLYPKDLEKRAVVNQRLFFDCGIIFPVCSAIVKPLLRGAAKTVSRDKADDVIEAYNLLETLLERSTYVAGDHLTLADFSIVATVSSVNVFVPIASNRYPKISDWFSKMQSLPYYAEANQVGLDIFTKMMKSKMA